MCNFISTLPVKNYDEQSTISHRNSIAMFLKPCPDTPTEKTWYRFRLLAFTTPRKSKRNYPFIERYVHQVWDVTDKGRRIIKDEVVCPVTKWVEFDGNRYEGCPMCRIANQYFISAKESKWKDREAIKKQNEFGRKYEAIVPVYVVNDPNYPTNNGKFKVLIFNDKNIYKDFHEKVKTALTKVSVFNGVNSVDCAIHVSESVEIRNEGQPNEFKFKTRVIDKITFSKNPYDIDSITKENVDKLEFDETFYVSSTIDELNAFYNKYFKVSNDDIDDSDSDIDLTNVVENKKQEVKKEPVVQKTQKTLENETIKESIDKTDDISVDDIDDILSSDSDNIDEFSDDDRKKSTPAKSVSEEQVTDDDIDSIIEELDID